MSMASMHDSLWTAFMRHNLSCMRQPNIPFAFDIYSHVSGYKLIDLVTELVFEPIYQYWIHKSNKHNFNGKNCDFVLQMNQTLKQFKSYFEF